METSTRQFGDVELTIHTVRTIVVGAGAAGLNTAARLAELGHEDMVLVTEKPGGVSADPVSAKSKYYRLGMDWDDPDSPVAFARTLCEGGMTHGDVAYVEAVNSIPAFLRLAGSGVPFPRDEYGVFLAEGQQGRTASAGPMTSLLITEKLDDRVRANRINTLRRHTVISLLTGEEEGRRKVVGALAVDRRKAKEPSEALVLFNCRNVVLATGGPSALFANTIHGAGSSTSLGLGLMVGAKAGNLTETRYGLTFDKSGVRLAGDLQRVMPNYYSTGRGGRDRKPFLAEYFDATKQIASAIFHKGNHWPFASEQLHQLGPSIIDIAVHNELADGRRVYVDFSENAQAPDMGKFNISQLDEEAQAFLQSTGATQFSPLQRLQHLDATIVGRLLDQKTDLREPQQVTISAEDTFGGLSIDMWWETSIGQLFAVGDVACTHGNPPEGAEVNAGQVGGLRAAERIVREYDQTPPSLDEFLDMIRGQVESEVSNLQRYVYGPIEVPSVRNHEKDIQERMSRAGGMIRGVEGLSEAIAEAREQYETLRTEGQRLSRQSQFVDALGNELLCVTEIAFLEAMKAYIENGGGSRGSYLVLDAQGDATVLTRRGAEMRHRNENMGMRNRILEVCRSDGLDFEAEMASVRPIPED